MSDRNGTLPKEKKGEWKVIAKHMVEAVLTVSAALVFLSIGVLLVLSGLGLQEPAGIFKAIGGVSLAVAAVAAVVYAQFWSGRKGGANEMPDSTKSDGVP